jgi:hypothetical protein
MTPSLPVYPWLRKSEWERDMKGERRGKEGEVQRKGHVLQYCMGNASPWIINVVEGKRERRSEKERQKGEGEGRGREEVGRSDIAWGKAPEIIKVVELGPKLKKIGREKERGKEGEGEEGGTSAEPVACAAIACRKRLARDNKGGRIGPKVEEKLAHAVEEDEQPRACVFDFVVSFRKSKKKKKGLLPSPLKGRERGDSRDKRGSGRRLREEREGGEGRGRRYSIDKSAKRTVKTPKPIN